MRGKGEMQATAFVVFGATGDLTQRKLYPALYGLAKYDALPKKLYLFGVAQKKLTDKEYKAVIEKEVRMFTNEKIDPKVMKRLLRHVHYVQADLNKRDGYDELEAKIQRYEKKIRKPIQRLFYLALPPKLFGQVAKNVETCNLGKALCSIHEIKSRIIVEKPFGYDLRSARKLDKELHRVFNERQIYRIDHYLGKEAVENIGVFRFNNRLIESMWNRDHIEQIQIHAPELVGLEDRAGYYDSAGALRDMLQNHLLQLLAYLTMDEPKEMTAKYMRENRAAVLQKLRLLKGKHAVRGQYKGYKKEKGIQKGSKTETYIAAAFEINTPRWKGVPIYIRTGKAMGMKETRAIIEFKQENAPANLIELQIAPVASVSMKVNVLKPGLEHEIDSADMHYCRGERFQKRPLADYERLIIDIIKGDQTRFAGSEEILAAWKAVTPLQKQLSRLPLKVYKQGSMGPRESDKILKQKGHEWLSSFVSCPYDR